MEQTALQHRANEDITQPLGVYMRSDIKALQELLLYVLKGISMYAHLTRQMAVTDRQIDEFLARALHFATEDREDLNVESLCDLLRQASGLRDRARTLYEWTCGPMLKQPQQLAGPAAWQHSGTNDALISYGRRIAPQQNRREKGDLFWRLEQLCILGVQHAAKQLRQLHVQGKTDEKKCDLVHEVLSTLASDPDVDALNALVLRLSYSDDVEALDATSSYQMALYPPEEHIVSS
ncbi:MAG: hypothetical protein QNJ97_01720 [Myxococcota bacterium]|nr:hypothetical protein [Myxococcota bacterium]